MPPDSKQPPFLLLVRMSQAVGLGHHLVSRGHPGCELLWDVLLRLCPAAARQQMEEGTVTMAGGLPAGTVTLFLGSALRLQVSPKLSLDFSFPFER